MNNTSDHEQNDSHSTTHSTQTTNEPYANAATDTILPKVTFSTFILSLASSALSQLGEVPHPDTGAIEQNLPMAKHTIEVLSMLEQKTKECLDSDEFRLLQGILYELRMKYVKKANS